jgi:Concanavalin A-like lectin/glucanases superfamily
MAAPTSRLLPTGQLYLPGLDEATFNSSSGYKKNLVTTSETFLNWAPNSGIIVQNATLAPDGISSAIKLVELATGIATNNQRMFYQPPTTAGVTYTFSVYLKAAERYIVRCYFEDTSAAGGGRVGQYLNLSTGTVISTYLTGTNTLISSNLEKLNGNWYRFTWTVKALVDSARNGTAYIILGMGNNPNNFQIAGDGVSGMYFWGAQMEVGPAATIYEGNDANGVPLRPNNLVTKMAPTGLYTVGSFDEVSLNRASGVTTNLVVDSYGFASSWNTQSASITRNAAVAPDGTQTATLVVGTAGATARKCIYNASGVPLITGATYTYSVYIKSAGFANATMWIDPTPQILSPYIFPGATVLISLRDGSKSGTNTNQVTVTPLDNGWYRCQVSTATPATPVTVSLNVALGDANGTGTAVGDGVNGVYVWGAQLEIGATATDYIPTDSTNKSVAAFVERKANTGLHRISGNYDEVAGVTATTNGLVANFDTFVPGTVAVSPSSTWTDSSDSTYYAPYQNLQNQSKFNTALSAFNFDNTTTGTGNTGFYITNQGNSRTLNKFYATTFTMEIWARCTSFNTGQHYNNTLCIWEYYQLSGFRFGINTPNGLSTDTTGVPRFWSDQSGGNFAFNPSGFPIALNTWFQTVVTYDGSICNLYYNGALGVTQTNAIIKNPKQTGTLYIGGNNSGCQSFNGQMSIFRWYNRALSTAEVADNYSGNRVRFGV